MTQHTVVISAVLSPNAITITVGDTVVWVNDTATKQTVNSNDGSQTFTTGSIQPGANSLPITVPASISYTVSPVGLQGSITVSA
jgi:plastocyanin